MKGVAALLAVATLAAIASAIPDFSGLPPGPYCASRRNGCCRGREDQCSYPIVGTLCYCDDFCDRNRTEDCCPDFWSFCRGLPDPQPTSRCTYKGRYVDYRQSITDNCNKCTCLNVDSTRVDMECTVHECLINQDIIKMVNADEHVLGWRATNYSEFWGRTLQDGVDLRLGTKHPKKSVIHIQSIKRIYDPAKLPKSFEAENKWPAFLSTIRDQGWCGSSWAISTTAVASDRLAIMSNGTEQVELSPQHLLSCNNRGQQSCHGGYLDRAWLYLRKYGVVDEDCYPYVGKSDRLCKVPRRTKLIPNFCDPPNNPFRSEMYKSSPAYLLGNETDIMYEILENGPVQATMKVHQDFFMYQGGVYKHSGLSRGEDGYESVNRQYHSVRIVGWGVDHSYHPPRKYWKVANSWGTDWGESGYFRIVRGKNECDIEKFVLGAWAKPVWNTDKEVPDRRSFVNYRRNRYRN